MTETDFNIDWLAERYRFDVAARSKAVEQACFQHFRQYDRLRIVDIGAGTGSNFLYLSPKFPQHQEWTFVELNTALLKAALDRIQRYAKLQGWSFDRNGNTMQFSTGKQQVSIKSKHGSFLELRELVTLGNVDLVTANAVFDLLSLKLFEQFWRQLIKYKLPLLATINYLGMAFAPQGERDDFFIKKYEAHMQREQRFGQSMGPDCVQQMQTVFKKQGVDYFSGNSTWQIGQQDTKMHQFLLQYLEEAVTELLTSPEESASFAAWLANKKTLLAAQELELTVFHQDLFVAPEYEAATNTN